MESFVKKHYQLLQREISSIVNDLRKALRFTGKVLNQLNGFPNIDSLIGKCNNRLGNVLCQVEGTNLTHVML